MCIVCSGWNTLEHWISDLSSYFGKIPRKHQRQGRKACWTHGFKGISIYQGRNPGRRGSVPPDPSKEIAPVNRPVSDAGQNQGADICCTHGFKLGSNSMAVLFALLPATLNRLGEGTGKGRRASGGSGQQIWQRKEDKGVGHTQRSDTKARCWTDNGKRRSFGIMWTQYQGVQSSSGDLEVHAYTFAAMIFKLKSA